MKYWREVDGLLLRLSAKRADRIRKAIAKSIDVRQAVDDWADHYPHGGQISPAMARDWARLNIPMETRPLERELEELHAEGWVLGADVALGAYAQAKTGITKAAPSAEQVRVAVEYDWDNWKPGNEAAAALVRPPLGLQQLLTQGRASVKGMNATILNRVGTHLANSLALGEGYTAVQKKLLTDEIISQTVKSPSHALAISVTEMSRALNVSSLNSYAGFGVEKVDWLALDPCDRCSANADQGALPIGTPFSTGDVNPPAHPHCRCTLLPVIPGDTAITPIAATPEMSISPVATHAIEDIVAEPISRDFQEVVWQKIPEIPVRNDLEKIALETYSGPMHKQMNMLLRGIDPEVLFDYLPGTEAVRKKTIQRLITDTERVQEMLARTSLPENTTVQRFLDKKELNIFGSQFDDKETLAKSLIGQTFENKGFLSTSAMQSERSISSPFNSRPIKLILRLPAGTKAGRNSISEFANEAEVIVAPGSKYIITNAYPENEHFIVEALLGEQ